MAGKSDQEEQAEKLYGEIGGLNPNVENRWNGYQNPYGFGDVEKKVNDTYSNYEDMINRDTSEEIAKQQGGAASSLASRGITGGSILTDTQSGIASDLNKSKTNALSNLGAKKSGMLSSLMEYFNNLKMGQTQAATNVDFGNMSNLFQKYGLKGGALGGLDSDTWLDDLFAGLNVGGNLAKGIGGLVTGGGGAGGAT